jgi:hypothetical protein
MDDALKETVFEYYIQQLRSAMQFINGLDFPVPPFLLLPFHDLPKRLTGMLTPVKAGIVRIAGVEVFAFPSWSDDCERLCPALPRCTASSDSVVFYQFTVTDDLETVFTDGFLERILTIHGRFWQFKPGWLADHQMIRVDGGDYVKSLDEVNVCSAMILMLNREVRNLSTSGIPKLFQIMSKPWGFPADANPLVSIQSAIAGVQKALLELEILPPEAVVDGVLHPETLRALKQFFTRNRDSDKKEFALNASLFRAVRESKRRLSGGR